MYQGRSSRRGRPTGASSRTGAKLHVRGEPVGDRRARRDLNAFTVFRDGHAYGFLYPADQERAALEVFSRSPAADPVEVLALACYLGHDPRTLDLKLPG